MTLAEFVEKWGLEQETAEVQQALYLWWEGGNNG